MKKFLITLIATMIVSGNAMAAGTDGKCCKRNPNINPNPQDCAAIEQPTWNAINAPGAVYSEALSKTCNLKFSPTLQPCVWDTNNPDCRPPAPSPTPKPSNGACCLMKPNANPVADCSDPIMNFGHPQGLGAAKNRCNQINQGGSCVWDLNNPKCCVPGMQGCGSTAGTLCAPPSVSIQFPFASLATDPAYAEQYKYCKTLAGNSPDPMNYSCCVTLPPKDPCAEKGLFSVPLSSMNITDKGYLCCTSKTPKPDLLSGGKVCCEFIKSTK